MSIVVGPSNYVEPYGSGIVPKPVPLHVDANGGLILGAGAVAALLGSVRIQDGSSGVLATVIPTPLGDAQGNALAAVADASFSFGYNGVGWDRLRAGLGIAGGTFSPTGVLNTLATGTDGTNGRVLATMGAIGDAAAGANTLSVAPSLNNGATLDRARSASAANLGATSGLGAVLSAPPGEWNANVQPGGGAAATATRAASAGVRHVCRSISVSLVNGAAPAATTVDVILRDGLTGVGAVMWQQQLSVPATQGAVDRLNVPGLNLVGTAGNAMTVDVSAPAASGTLRMAFTGFDAS